MATIYSRSKLLQHELTHLRANKGNSRNASQSNKNQPRNNQTTTNSRKCDGIYRLLETVCSYTQALLHSNNSTSDLQYKEINNQIVNQLFFKVSVWRRGQTVLLSVRTQQLWQPKTHRFVDCKSERCLIS